MVGKLVVISKVISVSSFGGKPKLTGHFYILTTINCKTNQKPLLFELNTSYYTTYN
jgi:hypothetical protein